jgi:hypothetical protein
MSKADIFFSYAREDQARVAQLVAALEAGGWSVFWDRRIPAGQTWRGHIGRALDQARCVVVAWSEHSIQSSFVIEEAGRGERRHVLVPVLLDLVEPPLGFGEIHAADLSGWSPERPSPAFDSFLADLGAVLGAPQPRPSPPSPAAEVLPAKQGLGDGGEPAARRRAAAVDPAGDGSAADPLPSGRVDTPHAAETPVPPAGQPAAAIGAPLRREMEVDLAPLAGREERSTEMAPPSDASQPTRAAHPAPLDAVPAEQARSSAAGSKMAGWWWLGMAALVVGTILAGGYAYLGSAPATSGLVEYRCDDYQEMRATYDDNGATVAAGDRTYRLDLIIINRDGAHREYADVADSAHLSVDGAEARLRLRDATDYTGCKAM